MQTHSVALLYQAECQELEVFLVERIYEFNCKATGYFDGLLFGGSVRGEDGDIIAGFDGHTWGGCALISHLWVGEGDRGRGLGTTLLCVAEAEAMRRGCAQVVLLTHNFRPLSSMLAWATSGDAPSKVGRRTTATSSS